MQSRDVNIPPFVKVIRDVSDDQAYNTSVMAKQNYKMPEQDKIAIVGAGGGNTSKTKLGAPAGEKKSTSSPKPSPNPKRQIPEGGDSPRVQK
jgi:hypothetical protein